MRVSLGEMVFCVLNEVDFLCVSGLRKENLMTD